MAQARRPPAKKAAPVPNVFLVKSEPSVYPWSQLVAEGRTGWTGVRNPEARNNLSAMRVGDLALYYHSNEGREIVGVAKVMREAYPDPSDDGKAWVQVDLVPVLPLARPVTLATLKADPALSKMQVVTRSRLSVTRVTADELARVLELGGIALRQLDRQLKEATS